jgi:hypothetical protein
MLSSLKNHNLGRSSGVRRHGVSDCAQLVVPLRTTPKFTTSQWAGSLNIIQKCNLYLEQNLDQKRDARAAAQLAPATYSAPTAESIVLEVPGTAQVRRL